MPVITATSVQTQIPAKIGRKQLLLRNTGDATLYFGWEVNMTAAGSTQGVPLEPGEFISFAGRDLDLAADLKLICATSTTVNYTERA